jgi:hypothetical protein
MRVYHFVPAEHGLTNIRYRRLKVATIDDLNDPFELLGPSAPSRADRLLWARWRSQIAARYGAACAGRQPRNAQFEPRT